MPLLKPIETDGIIGKLKNPTEKALNDYLESKKHNCEKISLKSVDPVGGYEYFIPQIKLEHNYYKDAQADMLQRVELKRKKYSRLKQSLFLEQRHLRKNFIHINSVLKDLIDRKGKAIKQLNQQQKEQDDLRELIDEESNKYKQLKDFRTKLMNTVDQYKPYAKVMEDVIFKSNIYTSEKDCSDRCEALLLSQVDAVNLINDKIKNMEIIRKNFIKLTKEVALKILGMQNILAELTREHNAACVEVHKWERCITEIKDEINRHFMEKERVLDGVNTLYTIMCKRSKVKTKYTRNEVEQQLDYIKEELQISKNVQIAYNSIHLHYKAKEKPKC